MRGRVTRARYPSFIQTICVLDSGQSGASQKIWRGGFLSLSLLFSQPVDGASASLSRFISAPVSASASRPAGRQDSQWRFCVTSRHHYHLFECDGLLEPELHGVKTLRAETERERERARSASDGGSFSSMCARLKHVIELGTQNGTLSVNLLPPSTCSPTSFTPSRAESSCSSRCKNADCELSSVTLIPAVVAQSTWSSCTPGCRESHF